MKLHCARLSTWPFQSLKEQARLVGAGVAACASLRLHPRGTLQQPEQPTTLISADGLWPDELACGKALHTPKRGRYIPTPGLHLKPFCAPINDSSN